MGWIKLIILLSITTNVFTELKRPPPPGGGDEEVAYMSRR